MAQSSPNLVFHWPVAGSPDKIPILLQVLANSAEPLSKSELDELAFEQSAVESRFAEARVLAEQPLMLLSFTKEGLQLTSRAKVVLKKREAVQLDLLHYLFYTAWQPDQPARQTQSWFYRAVCDQMWAVQSQNLDFQTRQSLTQELTNQVIEDFKDVPGFTLAKFSIGRQTMAGAKQWLRCLRPAVLTEDTFARRPNCSAELFLLALSRSYEMGNSVVGVDLLLSPKRREEICKVCLLEPSHFDRMLDWVIPIYPQYLAQGTRAGSYGRFMRLLRLVNVEDLA